MTRTCEGTIFEAPKAVGFGLVLLIDGEHAGVESKHASLTSAQREADRVAGRELVWVEISPSGKPGTVKRVWSATATW